MHPPCSALSSLLVPSHGPSVNATCGLLHGRVASSGKEVSCEEPRIRFPLTNSHSPTCFTRASIGKLHQVKTLPRKAKKSWLLCQPLTGRRFGRPNNSTRFSIPQASFMDTDIIVPLLSTTLTQIAENLEKVTPLGTVTVALGEHLQTVVDGENPSGMVEESAVNASMAAFLLQKAAASLKDVAGPLQGAMAVGLASAIGAFLGTTLSRRGGAVDLPRDTEFLQIGDTEGQGDREGSEDKEDTSLVPDIRVLCTNSSFNRFVMARCPRLRTNGQEEPNRASYFSPSFGSILEKHEKGRENGDLTAGSHSSELSGLQRHCLIAADGGVVALDWGADVSLTENDDMETTLLLVAGTPAGSADPGIRAFANMAQSRGLFAVILNPRGCGGSPVTSPRFFSAADSEDILLAAEYLSVKRPLSPLLAVGWGIGGSMMVKHLGESGLRTPLAAAVAIAAPLCLHEASLNLGRHPNLAYTTAILGGLKELLRKHQMLFEGTNSGFDVEKALRAQTVREFDSAITRVSLMCDNLEEYYEIASCKNDLGTVQVPLLCIQDAGDVQSPLLSLPLSALEGNPHIAMAVVSGCQNNNQDVPGSAHSWLWSIDLVLQWLAAVEVALLKGKRPKDEEGPPLPHIKPPGFLSEVKDPLPYFGIKGTEEARESLETITSQDEISSIELPMSASLNEDMSEWSLSGLEDVPSDLPLDDSQVKDRKKTPAERMRKDVTSEDAEDNEMENVDVIEAGESNESKESKELKESEESKEQEPPPPPPPEPVSVEAGQARAAAESVLNMLDVTRPGILPPEQKEKVLAGVGRGESLLNLLQEAVPEDVRGSLTTAAQEAIKAKNVSFSLLNLAPGIPLNTGASPTSSSSPATTSSPPPSPSPSPSPSSSLPPSPSPSPSSPSTSEGEQPQSSASEGGGESKTSSPPPSPPPPSKPTEISESQQESTQAKELPKGVEDAGGKESKPGGGLPRDSGTEQDGGGGGGGGVGGSPEESVKGKGDGGEAGAIPTPKSSETSEGKEGIDSTMRGAESTDSGNRVNETNTNTNTEEGDKQMGNSENPTIGRSKGDEVKGDEVQSQSPALNQTGNPVPGSPPEPAMAAKPVPPPKQMDMKMAMEALTGLDDSTQMAVTNVLGVVDSMLSRLEAEQMEKEAKEKKEVKEEKEANEEKEVTTEAKSTEGISQKEKLEGQEKGQGHAGNEGEVKSDRKDLNEDGQEGVQKGGQSAEEFRGRRDERCSGVRNLKDLKKNDGNKTDQANTEEGKENGSAIQAKGEDKEHEKGLATSQTSSFESSNPEGRIQSVPFDNLSSTKTKRESSQRENGSIFSERSKVSGENIKPDSHESKEGGRKSGQKQSFPPTGTNRHRQDDNSNILHQNAFTSHPPSSTQTKVEAREVDKQAQELSNIVANAVQQQTGNNVGFPQRNSQGETRNGSRYASSSGREVAMAAEDVQEWVKARARGLAEGTLLHGAGPGQEVELAKTPKRRLRAVDLNRGNAGEDKRVKEKEKGRLSHQTGDVTQQGKQLSSHGQSHASELVRGNGPVLHGSTVESERDEARESKREDKEMSQDPEKTMVALESSQTCEPITEVLHSSEGNGKAVTTERESTQFPERNPNNYNEKNNRILEREEETASTTTEPTSIEADHSKKAIEGSHEKEGKDKEEQKMQFTIVGIVNSAIKLELLRRLGEVGTRAVGINMEDKLQRIASSVVNVLQKEGVGGLGKNLSKALKKTIMKTHLPREIFPIGMLVGLVLFVAIGTVLSLKKDKQEVEKEEEKENEVKKRSSTQGEPGLNKTCNQKTKEEKYEKDGEGGDDGSHTQSPDVSSMTGGGGGGGEETRIGGGEMVGVMTAAVGASVAFGGGHNNNFEGQKESGGGGGGPLSSLAEKAMSVASPVLPRAEDGSVDQGRGRGRGGYRLVAMLTELGQRGGMLRLVGKGALLWGGLRGAIGLVERLINFFRIRERPLLYRLLAFLLMALLLWTPVLVPLLPSLLQQWATSSPGPVTHAALAVGLYGAFFILVRIWGSKVRGYEKPLWTYGLRLLSREHATSLIQGLAGGVGLVVTLTSVQLALGYEVFLPMTATWQAPIGWPMLRDGALALFKAARLVLEAFSMGLAVAIVEEVLFRAWLQEELAADMGYHFAALTTAVIFSVVHWSPQAMVGLGFLSLALTGLRAKRNGFLAAPIGLHAGLVAANFLRDAGGFLSYVEGHPHWLTGAHVRHPLAGAMAMALMGFLVMGVYPWNVPSGAWHSQGVHKVEREGEGEGEG